MNYQVFELYSQTIIKMIKSATLILFMVVVSFSRLYINQFTLPSLQNKNGWIFLDRMSVGIGKIDITFQATLSQVNLPEKFAYQVQLVIVGDDAWQKETQLQCSKPQVEESNSEKRIINMDFKKQTNFNVKGSISFDNDKPQTYHVVLKDCQNKLATEFLQRNSRLNVSLEIKNVDQLHGEDQQSLSYLLPISLVLTGIMLYLSRRKKDELEIIEGNTDWAKILFHIALWLNFIALLLLYVGFLVYSSHGQENAVYDLGYLFFHSISEGIICGMLIFIAFGWTITYEKNNNFDMYIPLMIILGFINIILTILTKINDGDHDKYHMHDTIPSSILLLLRICSLAIFLVGIITTYKSNTINSSVLAFLLRIALMGSLYFLSLPFMLWVSKYIPLSSQKSMIFMIQELLKNLMNLWLTWMVSSKKSSYSLVNKGGKSFMEDDNKYL